MKVNIVYDDFRTSFSYSLDTTWYEVCLKLIEYVIKKFWRVQYNELEKIDLNWPVWLCLFND